MHNDSHGRRSRDRTNNNVNGSDVVFAARLVFRDEAGINSRPLVRIVNGY